MSKEGKVVHLRKKSHQIQFDFNELVAGCVSSMRDELKKRPATGTGLNKALKVLEGSTELLTTWQNLIKLVDRSEVGWKVVHVGEYKANELALGSEGKKKLERTVERKAVKKQKTTGR